MCKLSIVIPVYNARDWVGKCIRNLKKLDFREYEILLINDGSTDETKEICQKLAAEDPRIHLISQKNQGVSAARNRGIEQAQGEFLLFHDVDDEVDVEALSSILKASPAWEDQDLILLGASFDYYSKGRCYRRDLTAYPIEGLLTREAWMGDLLTLYQSNALNSVWAKLFRTDLLKKENIRFNTNLFLYEDLEFVLRYLKACQNIYNDPAGIYHYRIEEGKSNPGNRLKRIPDLNLYMKDLEAAFENLLSTDVSENPQLWEEMELILVKLYLILIREKSDLASVKEIRSVCRKAALWFAKKEGKTIDRLSEGEKSVMDLFVNQKVGKILLRRTYINVRHKIAVMVKRHGH